MNRHPFILLLLFLFGLASCSTQDNEQTKQAGIEVQEANKPFGLVRKAIYTSTNQGRTWNALKSALPVDAQVSFMEVIGSEIIVATDNYGTFISESNKTKWKQVGAELPNNKINALHVSGRDIFVGVYQEGIYTSQDNGKTWTSLNYNLSDLRVQVILMTSGTLMVGTDTGIFKYNSELRAWKNFFDEVQVLSLNEHNGKIIAGTSSGVILSENGGDDWKQIHDKGAVHNTAILNGDIFIMYLSGDLYIGRDFGKEWIEANYTPRIGSYVYEIANADNYLVMSNNYGIHNSTDRGNTWRLVYETEEMVFFDFLNVNNSIYGGTREWNEFRKKSAATKDIKPMNQEITTASGLIYEVIETGSGPVAKPGDLVLVHETTQMADGTFVTDTWKLNNPIRFLLGGNQVIQGMDEAVTGMRVGERRIFIVPPSLSKRSTYPKNGLYGPADTLYYNLILLQISDQ